MIHVFNPGGSLLVQDSALYGKDMGDALGKSSLEGGPRVTPSGKYTLVASADPEYTGGYVFRLAETEDDTGLIAVHAVYTGDPQENRTGRLKSGTLADKRASYGCINTTNDTFLNKLLPNADTLDGGMIFVLPDSSVRLGAFTATTEPVMGKATERTSGVGTEQRDGQTGLPKQEKRGQQRSGSRRRMVRGDTVDVITPDSRFEGSITDEDSLRRFPGFEAAIKHYERSGLRHVVDGVELWMIAPDTVDFDAAIMDLDGKQTLAVRAGILANTELLEWAMHHEMGHIADDAVRADGVHSQALGLSVSISGGKLVPIGAVMREVVSFRDSNPNSDFAQKMKYPLDRKTYGKLDAKEVRMETFAQLWAMFNTRDGREFLEDNLPATFDAMEVVYEAAKRNQGRAAPKENGTGAGQGAGQGAHAQDNRGAQGGAATVPKVHRLSKGLSFGKNTPGTGEVFSRSLDPVPNQFRGPVNF